MKARLHDLSLARDGGYLLTIATRENVGALYDELRETDVDVTVKKHREKRSLGCQCYVLENLHRYCKCGRDNKRRCVPKRN